MKIFRLAAVLFLLPAAALNAQLSADFINVGQGDSTYIVLPNGRNVLIDGGPSGQVVLDFLKKKGVTTLDHVVLTHPHSDHFMGLKAVFRNFQVKNFYDTRADNTDAVTDDEVRQMAATEPGCKVHYPETGSTLNWDSRVTVKVLNTCSDPIRTDDSAQLNNCSIVMRFFYNGHGLLMTGDIEAPIENAMTRLFKSGLDSTYLKVSHHGSNTSSAPKFIERVQPRVAIISVGEDNDYGHPHKEVLDRLTAAGAQIFTTLDGDKSLVIPAPKRGVELIVEEGSMAPVEQPRAAAPAAVPAPRDSDALLRLFQEAAAE